MYVCVCVSESVFSFSKWGVEEKARHSKPQPTGPHPVAWNGVEGAESGRPANRTSTLDDPDGKGAQNGEGEQDPFW